MKVINERYKIIDTVERDDTGITYVVEDLFQDNKTVLLKIFPSEMSKSKVVKYFIDNFKNISGIKHKYILSNERFDIIDKIDNKEAQVVQYFYTTEVIDDDLISYKSLTKKQRIQVFMKLCYALSYVHFKGITYKYLNFESVYIIKRNNEIEVKLSDVASIYQYGKDMNKLSIYNKKFVAPEANYREKREFAGDIYSLGMMFYYLYNNLDYKKEFDNSLMESESEVDKFIARMTSLNIQDRYNNIEELMIDFEEIFDMEYKFIDKKYYEKLNFKTNFIGRKREKFQVLSTIEDKIKDRTNTRCYFICGEKGIGKTRFLSETYFELRMKKINTCKVSFKESNGNINFAFREVIKFIISKLDITSQLIKKYGSELAKINPELAKKWNLTPSKTLSKDLEMLRLNNRIFNFIRDYAQQSPLVLVIDNMEFAGENDFKILDYLINDNREIPIFLICTYRDFNSLPKEFYNKWSINDNVESVYLEKFTIDEVSEFLKNILGIGRKPLDRTVAKIMKETEGNPYYIEEFMKNFRLKKLLYVEKDRSWCFNVDKIEDLEFPGNVDNALLNSIEVFSSDTKRVLDVLSIFNSMISFDIILKITNIEYDKLVEILEKLVELKIVDIKFKDYVNKYSFYNKQIKRIIYKRIENSSKVKYHNKASELFLEQLYNEEKIDKNELIYHLKNCFKYKEAAEFCLKFAKEMQELSLNNQAIKYYYDAIELLKKTKNNHLLVYTFLDIGEIYFDIEGMDNALNCIKKALKIAMGINDKKAIVDSNGDLVKIYIKQKKIEEANEIITKAMSIAKDINYLRGEMKLALYSMNIKLLNLDLKEYEESINYYLKIARDNNDDFYIAQFLNETGKLMYYKGKIEESLENYEKSYEYFNKSGDKIEGLKSLNNIGVIYQHLGNAKKSREYLYKCLDITRTYNLKSASILYRLNIGASFSNEQNHHECIRYTNEALQISLETGMEQNIFLCYNNLCITYLNLHQYDKAYLYLKKLREEFKKHPQQGRLIACFYITHMNFYLNVENYNLVEEWYNKGKEHIGNFDESSSIDMFEGELLKNINTKKDLDKEYIKNRIMDKYNDLKPRRLRNMILNISYDLYKLGKMKIIEFIIELDNELESKYDDEILRIKKGLILGFDKENKIQFYKKLLNKARDNYLYNYEWIICKILADEYYNEGDFYNALSYNISSLNLIRKLTFRVPKQYRYNYLFNDEVKIAIKSNIYEIYNIVNNVDKYDTEEIHITHHESSVESYFDIKQIDGLLNNKKILDAIHEEYKRRFSIDLRNINDLTENFQADPLYNIELILKYSIQLCFAERGCIYLVDEKLNIQDKIIIGDSFGLPDISKLIKRKAEKNLILEKSNYSNLDFEYNELYNDDIKASICIPIEKIDENYIESDKNKRKHDSMKEKEIVGFLYLDTDKVLNNFSRDTFNRCKNLVNLVYTMIENYKLRKISTIDDLTKTYLRKYVESAFEKEIVKAKGNESKISVVMADIDNFKHINDNYGHMKGDEALVKIAKVIRVNTRNTDYIGRYGGEEFIMLLPQADENEAYLVCENIRKSIECLTFYNEGIPLTISLGIATFPDQGHTKEELVEKADQALYHSKEEGKNRTTIWNKDIGSHRKRLDKLAGIITGNVSNDHRKVEIIIKIINLLKINKSKSDRLYEVLKLIIHEYEAKIGAIFEIKDSEITNQFVVERFSNGWTEMCDFSDEIVGKFIDREDGDYFIDWSNTKKVDTVTGMPNWDSVMVIPLFQNGEKKGILTLSVPIDEREFGAEAYNFINSISSIIAAML